MPLSPAALVSDRRAAHAYGLLALLNIWISVLVLVPSGSTLGLSVICPLLSTANAMLTEEQQR